MAKKPKLRIRQKSAVGYGRPPKHTQFRPGRSGNPRGRPRGVVNIATVLQRTLLEPVVVNEGGRRRTITKFEAAVKQLTNKAAAGDPHVIKLLLDLVRVVEGRFETPGEKVVDLPQADRDVMARILGRLERAAKGGANETQA